MRLAERLMGLGVTAQSVRACSERDAALRSDDIALVLRWLRDGMVPSAADAERLLHGVALPGGLLCEDGGAAFRLEVIERLYLFSDWASGARDEVLPPGETTAILYRAAREFLPAEQLLDLGCGSGTLALLLGARCGRVVGSDLNSRAIALARLNEQVNGMANAEWRCGDLFEPLHGERFDLIVSQPPYVPVARDAEPTLFLSGGERGDELAQRLIRGIAEHLKPEGVALVFSDWPLRAGERLEERIPVPAGLATDLYCSPAVTVDAYARDYGLGLREHFTALGVVGVQQCLLVLRRGKGLWRRREVLPHEWKGIGALVSSKTGSHTVAWSSDSGGSRRENFDNFGLSTLLGGAFAAAYGVNSFGARGATSDTPAALAA